MTPSLRLHRPEGAAAAPSPAHATPGQLDEIRRYLGALEVPDDCDCPLDLSCPCAESCTGQGAENCPCCRGECDCPPALFQPPCRHIIERGLTLEELAALLHSLDPTPGAPPPPAAPCALPLEQYVCDLWDQLACMAEPREHYWPRGEDQPAEALAAPDRVEVYAWRQRRRLALYNPLDYWRQPDEDLGIHAPRLRNGAVTRDEVVRTGKAAA